MRSMLAVVPTMVALVVTLIIFVVLPILAEAFTDLPL